MNDANKKKVSSITKFAGAKSPPGLLNPKRLLLVSFLLFSFLLAIGIASATITVTGDLQNAVTWDIYVYDGVAGATNPCSGTGSEDDLANVSGDLSYDDNDDYTLSWAPGGAADVNVWFCDDLQRIANFTKGGVADGTTIIVDLGAVSGSTHNDLDNDYVFVCTDFNGTRLNTQGASFQVDAGTNQYTQYYAFEDGVAANESVYVFLDNDNTDDCIWDESKTTARKIDTTSADAYENYGIAAEFGPETIAYGYGHNDFDYGDGNTDKLMIGMARFADLGATEATRYTAYYDDTNSGNVYKVQVIKNADPSVAPTVTPDMNILQVAGGFTSLDFNILVNGDMPTELDLVSSMIGTIMLHSTQPTPYNTGMQEPKNTSTF